MGDSSESFSAPEDEAPREYQANDSDSDGPILYTDDDDEEDDDDFVFFLKEMLLLKKIKEIISSAIFWIWMPPKFLDEGSNPSVVIFWGSRTLRDVSSERSSGYWVHTLKGD